MNGSGNFGEIPLADIDADEDKEKDAPKDKDGNVLDATLNSRASSKRKTKKEEALLLQAWRIGRPQEAPGHPGSQKILPESERLLGGRHGRVRARGRGLQCPETDQVGQVLCLQRIHQARKQEEGQIQQEDRRGPTPASSHVPSTFWKRVGFCVRVRVSQYQCQEEETLAKKLQDARVDRRPGS